MRPRLACSDCSDCLHKFATLKEAERATFGHVGCPTCGGRDIELGKPTPHSSAKYAHDCQVCIVSGLSPEAAINAHVEARRFGR